MTMKKVLYGVLILLGMILAGACIYLNSVLPIITGYAAKNLCSDIFISGRKAEDVEAVDLNFSFIKYTKNRGELRRKECDQQFFMGKCESYFQGRIRCDTFK